MKYINHLLAAKAVLSLLALLLISPVVSAVSEPGYVQSHNSIRLALSKGKTVDNLGADQDQEYNFSDQIAPTSALSSLHFSASVEYSAWDHSSSCEYKHSDTKNGESVFAGRGLQWTIDSAIKNWALEVKNYDFSKGCESGESCGNYTQIVWDKTTQVGCAISSCNAIQDQNGDDLWGGDVGMLVVCQYTAKGNMPGQKPYASIDDKRPAPEIKPKVNTQALMTILSLLLE